MASDESEKKPLMGVVRDEFRGLPRFWVRSFKDPNDDVSAQDAWNGATVKQGLAAAKWIRSWGDEEVAQHVRETMGGLDGMLKAVFLDEAYERARRFAASVLLDVFGEPEDLAKSLEMRPKFDGESLKQFRALTHLSDLWEGQGSQAEELLDYFLKDSQSEEEEIIENVHEILTLWIIANGLAEVFHTRLKKNPPPPPMEEEQKLSAREVLIEKAKSIRAATHDEDDDDDDDDDDWVDDKEDLRKPLPRSGPRPRTAVGEFYETHDLERKRHQQGYDVLDLEMKNDMDKKKKRELLVEHLSAARKAGLVTEATFEERKLGISVRLAKYGKEGRSFIVVDTSSRKDVRPGDELVSVNGAFVVDPVEDSVAQVIRFVDDAPRPIILTFVKGESNEDHFHYEKKVSEKIILSALDVDGSLKLDCRDDGTIRKYRSFHDGLKQKSRLIGLFTTTDDTLCIADRKGTFLGSVTAKNDSTVAEIIDAQEKLLAYCDLSSLRLLDSHRTTILEIEVNGTVKGHDGRHVGTLKDFDAHHFRLLGLIITFLRPHLFRDPHMKKQKSIGRLLRKSSARLTGVHGFFA